MNHLNTEHLLGYLDQSLDAVATENVKSHLQRCESCRQDLELHRVISQSAKRQKLERPSARFTAGVMDIVLAPASIPMWKKATTALRHGSIVVVILFGLVWSVTQSLVSSAETSPQRSFPFVSDAVSLAQSLNENTARWIASLAQNALGETTGKYLAIAALAMLMLVVMDKFVIQRFVKISIEIES